jgi:hypothetical protein
MIESASAIKKPTRYRVVVLTSSRREWQWVHKEKLKLH